MVVTFLLVSCNTNQKRKPAPNPVEKQVVAADEETDRAEIILNESFLVHGGDRFDNAHYVFDFRNKHYAFKYSNGSYHYTVKSVIAGKQIEDQLENGQLTRKINGEVVALTEKDVAKYTEALNSVIYFASIPYKLKDKAVNKSYEGTSNINGKSYEVLGITFDQKNGGKDFEDQFYYWINSETKTIDFLAYNYKTDGGGVRFRSAYNPRIVSGIRFQDYINYEAPLGTPLMELPVLYEKGRLKKLSEIRTENIAPLNN